MIAWALIILALVLVFPAKALAAILVLILVAKIIGMFITPPNMGMRGGGSSGGGR